MENGQHVPSFKDDMKSLLDGNLHITLMTLPCSGHSGLQCRAAGLHDLHGIYQLFKEDSHLTLFDWNGFTQFNRVLNMNGNIGRQFWHVLAWTVVWAIFATFLNYILGMILAMVINRKGRRTAKHSGDSVLYYPLPYRSLFL
jgi:arabinogalactan oligomer/maltooligosaccharide transport system permease protein